ncbi:GNAT family N-acetyltransferase [Desertivirga brevis]|uniref:GNAT family N-acetyltransferase n=1 Tax=Desertivirga brevis TaxID=2810310 RepID=UPI001A9621AB|nr:GNAT family N-acetyltransferase [Pedobacter sp. SYSU D00873]
MTKGGISKASACDYNELTEVWEASVRATHDFITEKDILFFKPLILNEYLVQLRLYYVKNYDNEIQGFIGFSEDKVEMLFVKPKFFGKGIGKALLSFAIDFHGVKKVDVNEQNLGAIAFYHKMGFQVYDRVEVDGLGKPYPLLLMELSLN